MRAMLLESSGKMLVESDIPVPRPAEGQILVAVHTCGVCRTDLHVTDGELPATGFPIIPGHEIVGNVVALGTGTTGFRIGDRVGIPWLGWTCGRCTYCQTGQENLCERALFTGYQIAGGYAEFVAADHRFCFHLPPGISDTEVAPLLCAGLIGYRAYRMAGPVRHLGLYGFGAAAHILAQVARAHGISVYAFTRPEDIATQAFARELGVAWAGAANDLPPERLDAAIIFAPAGELVPAALRTIRKGGRVVCAGIHMSDIPSFPYDLLWGERSICSVANLTRQDAVDFLAMVPQLQLRIHPVVYDLSEANRALSDLRAGRVQGAAVLSMLKPHASA